jgi:hypothetical protein
MQTTLCNTVVGVFTSRSQADKAVDALFEAGFRANHIGMVTRDGSGNANPTVKSTARSDEQATVEAENAGTGAATGAAAGAGVGALIGWGVLTGAIPVIGPALMAGTLGIIASNALAGAGVAGVVGALTGWGVSEEHAKHYESEVAAGRVIITVTAEDRCEEARAILKRYGATSKDPSFAA